MISPSLGEMTITQIAKRIVDYAKRNEYDSNEINVIIGTDSQNFSKTKVVAVIAVQHVGHGGFFFYDITTIPRISNIKQKLLYETQVSISVAEELMGELDKIYDETAFDYTEYMNFGIHVDAGNNGPTKVVIPEVVGWIKSCGFIASVKPDAFVASSIADRLSK